MRHMRIVHMVRLWIAQIRRIRFADMVLTRTVRMTRTGIVRMTRTGIARMTRTGIARMTRTGIARMTRTGIARMTRTGIARMTRTGIARVTRTGIAGGTRARAAGVVCMQIAIVSHIRIPPMVRIWIAGIPCLRLVRRMHIGILAVTASVLLPGMLCAQGGYYISRHVTLPLRSVVTQSSAMPIAVNREDVKAIGMGRAQVALGTTFTALTYNPALLARDRFALEVPSLQASLPTETYDAVFFLEDNIQEFEQAFFLTDVRKGIDQFNAATTNQERLSALGLIQHGLQFPRDLLDNVIGPSTSPKTHGVLIIPAITAQLGQWGVAVHANLQSGFQVIQSSTLEALASIEVPTTLADRPAVVRAVTQLAAVLQTITNPDGSFSLDDALPKAFAVSYLDIVGTVGYGQHVTDDLSLGAALKVINRRFSTKRMAADTFDEILTEVRKDFAANITGITLDVGGLYRFPDPGIEIGLSVQNILPFKTILSSMNAEFAHSMIFYDRDGTGQIITNASGDTALVHTTQQLRFDHPFELKLPVIVNVGASLAITPDWDVAMDVTDVARQDIRYENYFDRLRLGTEYRLEAVERVLGISGRVGMADRQWTLGLGLNLGRVLQLDAAYAHDSYVNARSYFLQARLGW